MLDILCLFLLCRKIGKTVEAKGHGKIGYQVMLVVFWIIGEVAGIVIGALVLQPGEDGMLVLIVPALIGAACGAGLAFIIASSLSDVRPVREYAPYDDDGRWDDRVRGDLDRPRSDEYTDQPPRERSDDRYRDDDRYR